MIRIESILSLGLCFILFSLFSKAAISAISYFPGRSGDIIFTPENIQDDSYMILLKNQEIEGELRTSKEIPETSVADLISHLLGTSVINENADRSSFPHGSIFNKAKANLLIVVDGVGKELGSRYLPSLFSAEDNTKELMFPGQQLSLRRIAYPQDSITSLTTLITGYTPSIHGITASSWRDHRGTMLAYRAEGLRHVPSMADHVTRTFDGRSLTVSISLDFPMAAALGVHQYIATANDDWNHFGFFWDEENQRFSSFYDYDNNAAISEFPSIPTTAMNTLRKSLYLTREQIIGNLQRRSFPLVSASDSIRFQEDHLTIFSVLENYTFDTNNQEEFLFFAELEFVFSFLDALETRIELSSLVIDAIPDMFSFAFSSIRKLRAVYGDHSSCLRAALHIMENSIVQITDRLARLYGNKLVGEAIFLGDSSFQKLQASNDLKEIVYPVVRRNVQNQMVFEQYFPIVYVERFRQDIYVLCHNLREVSDSVQVFCASEDYYLYTSSDMFLSNQLTDNNDSGNGTTPEDITDAEIFQITLWTSLIIAIVFIVAVYSMTRIFQANNLDTLNSNKSHAH